MPSAMRSVTIFQKSDRHSFLDGISCDPSDPPRDRHFSMVGPASFLVFFLVFFFFGGGGRGYEYNHIKSNVFIVCQVSNRGRSKPQPMSQVRSESTKAVPCVPSPIPGSNISLIFRISFCMQREINQNNRCCRLGYSYTINRLGK